MYVDMLLTDQLTPACFHNNPLVLTTSYSNQHNLFGAFTLTTQFKPAIASNEFGQRFRLRVASGKEPENQNDSMVLGFHATRAPFGARRARN